MNNLDKNIRTLIVSFTIAVFALIPLRFVEAGEQLELASVREESRVLGESIEVQVPEEEMVVFEARLEAPYDELESNVVEDEVVLE